MKLTLGQKRFLIVWIGFHSLILFVNKAEIKGELSPKSTPTGLEHRYLFTSLTDEDSFWPFTTYNHYSRRVDTVKRLVNFEGKYYPSSDIETVEHIDYYFNGIFNSYGVSEYLFYIIMGLGIVYLPKIWNNKTVS